MPTISRQATVESSKLANDVTIGAFSYIGPDVRIGAGTVVGSHVTITGRTVIGEGNRIFPGAVIGPGDDGANGKIKIGQANSIREYMVIEAPAKGATRIGNDCLLMVACRIGAGATVGNHVVLTNRTIISEGVTLADYPRSSGFALVEPNVTVGSYSFIHGYARIDVDAPPFAMLIGDPYQVRGINARLLQRCGYGDDDIRCLREAYRDIYNGPGRGPDPDAIARLLAEKKLNSHVRQAVRSMTGGAHG